VTDERRNAAVVRAVGAIVVDDAGRLLMIQRAQDPGAGAWSLPGGRVEPGEDDATALRREMREETGLDVEVGELVGSVERAGAGVVFAISDYRCRIVGGTPMAGSDAAAIGWFAPADLDRLPLVSLLADTLREWRVL
jgi:ADP-ribose pyrophosphatase YjhB (NUDIX family)